MAPTMALWLVLVLASLACGCAADAPRPPASAPPAELVARPQKSIAEAEAELAERIRAVVVAERPHLRACYEEALAKTPGLAGRVMLVVEVSQSGKASRVMEARREGLGDAEVKCFARVLEAAHFHDGAASAVTIQVPLSFTPAPP